MYRPRIIPCLLLKDKGLVKSVRFDKHRYVGDPMNAVKIFNDKLADELIFLDITATAERRGPSLELIERIGDETNMPFAVGGGLRDLDTMRQVLRAGAEKVCLNTVAVEQPEVVRQAAETFGSSTITVVIDVKKKLLGKQQVYIRGGKKSTGIDPVQHARKMAELGAGEIVINSIERDGTMSGFDLDLIRRVADAVPIPVIALGGGGSITHFQEAIDQGHASAVAAGSFFVFHGARRAVLISFPTQEELVASFAQST